MTTLFYTGRNGGKMFQVFEEFQKAVKEGKKTLFIGREVVAMPVKDYEALQAVAEEQRKALEFFADGQNYVYATGMSPANKDPKVLREGRLIARHALSLTPSGALAKREAVRKALEPFSHPDLSKIIGGNALGDESIVFQRNEAILRIKDFIRAREALESF